MISESLQNQLSHSNEDYWPCIKYYVLLSFVVRIAMNFAFIISFLIRSEIWRTFLKEEAEKFLNHHSYVPFFFMAELNLFAWRENVSPLEIVTFIIAAFVLNNFAKSYFASRQVNHWE